MSVSMQFDECENDALAGCHARTRGGRRPPAPAASATADTAWHLALAHSRMPETRRFCASVVSGMDKRAAAELHTVLGPVGLLSVCNTKQGKVFFTLPVAAVGPALPKLAALQHTEHVYAVLLEGEFPEDQVQQRGDGGGRCALRPEFAASLPGRVPTVLWAEAAAAARALQRLQRGGGEATGQETQAPEAGAGERPDRVVHFRADCKAGKQSHHIRRAASAAFARSVAAIHSGAGGGGASGSGGGCRWEPALRGDGLLHLSIFLHLLAPPVAPPPKPASAVAVVPATESSVGATRTRCGKRSPLVRATVCVGGARFTEVVAHWTETFSLAGAVAVD
jgi:hypothetical protein